MASPTTFSSSFSSASFASGADTEEPMADEATARAWLAEEGFVEGDLRSEIIINQRMRCPMAWASQKGELGVCKWLYDNGAADDIRKANSTAVATPLYLACQDGHLSVCKWLFEVGAAADITKARNNGCTPLKIAFQIDHISICHWLILNGALSDPDPEADDDHVDQDVVERDVRPANKRPALLGLSLIHI